MTANPSSDFFHPCSAGFTVSQHGPRTRTDSGFGETEHHNPRVSQHCDGASKDDTVPNRSLDNTLQSRVVCETTLFTGRDTRHTLHRQDSVTTSSGSSDKRRRKGGSSRRSSTQSARPSMPRTASTLTPSSRQEDPLVCYQRSVSLFKNGSPRTSAPNVPMETYSAPCSPGSKRPMVSTTNMTGSIPPKTWSPYFIDTTANPMDEMEEEYESVPATVIHWTSPQTRKLEYEEIDRLHSGLHGFWRRVAPKWLCPRAPAKFYDEKQHSDAGSVRRHRLELPPDEDEDESEIESTIKQGRNKRPTISGSLSCF